MQYFLTETYHHSYWAQICSEFWRIAVLRAINLFKLQMIGNRGCRFIRWRSFLSATIANECNVALWRHCHVRATLQEGITYLANTVAPLRSIEVGHSSLSVILIYIFAHWLQAIGHSFLAAKAERNLSGAVCCLPTSISSSRSQARLVAYDAQSLICQSLLCDTIGSYSNQPSYLHRNAP